MKFLVQHALLPVLNNYTSMIIFQFSISQTVPQNKTKQNIKPPNT